MASVTLQSSTTLRPAVAYLVQQSKEGRKKKKKRVGFGEYVRGGGGREEGKQEIEWGN